MSAIFKTKQEQLSQNEIRSQNTQEVGVDHPAAYFLMQLIALVPSDMGFLKVWINPGEPRIDDKKIISTIKRYSFSLVDETDCALIIDNKYDKVFARVVVTLTF